ncbi:MAG: glutamate--tRNA ligase family protein [Candidatus Pacebacteria bacterium]|nr:glutamate--tRNA ligase family protein [Candidatus Paceibacterota bacterium]
MTSVVTRIPPSPTGRFHIGTARTALFNYLFARHAGGTIVFRSEDTDRTRSAKEHEDEIVAGLAWLGISWDSFSRQSEHTERYRELLEKIVGEGKAYISKEPGKEDPSTTVEVVRLRNPGTDITFTDLIRGDITFNTAELGDFVIARSMNDALYHFAVVADDMDSGVTHVIRGEDHISNTPRQILIQQALGAPRPAYAHLPLILDEKRAKLSKRSGTATSVVDYQDEGILPEALVNYLALLGWNPGDNREYFSLEELVEAFTLEKVQKSGAAWSREKLLSVNQHWMRALSDSDFLAHVRDIVSPSSNDGLTMSINSETLKKAVPMLKERAHTFSEAREMLSGELSCLFSVPEIDPSQLVKKELPDTPDMTKTALESLLEALKALPEGLSPEAVKEALMPLADAAEAKGKGGRGALLWPLRYALSGADRSPDPFTLVSILGVAESVSRVQKAIAILRG